MSTKNPSRSAETQKPFHGREGLKGTKEWSDVSYNICTGCEHDCLYCYARANACRFDPAMRQPLGWRKQHLNPRRQKLGQEVVGAGVVMFPTSHDLTPRFASEAITTIQNLIANRNKVLVVSKPHFSVVQRLCSELSNNRDDVMFRFTIGSLSAGTCAYWEPGAPAPAERLRCLRHAFACGFQTSVSVEPMLEDRAHTAELVSKVEPYVTDTVWIGKAQRIPQKFNAHVPNLAAAVARLQQQQCDTEILSLVEALRSNPKVRWKDSITKVLLAHRRQ